MYRSPITRRSEFFSMAIGAVWLCKLAVILTLAEASKVLELSDRFLDVYKDGMWLVKFYAPWCGFCKKLTPVWNQVAQSLHYSPVRVARVDCTRFVSVATEFSVKGFPTILFIKGDRVYSFRGDRTREEIVEFALRLSGPAIKRLENCEEAKSLQNRHSVFFVYFGTDEESDLKRHFEEIATEYQVTNFFYSVPVTCKGQILSTEANSAQEVHVFKDGMSYKFEEPLEEDDVNATLVMSEWVNKERFANFLKITHGNFPQLMQSGKLIVMAVLEEDKAGRITPEMQKFQEMVRQVSTEGRDEFHDRFQFGWLGQPSLANSVAMERLEVPSIIVVDSATYYHYVPDDDPAELTADIVTHFLHQILNQSARAYGGDTFFHRIYRMYYEATTSLVEMWQGNPVLTAVLFGLPLGFLSLICYSICCADILDANEDEEPEPEIRHEKKE